MVVEFQGKSRAYADYSRRVEDTAHFFGNRWKGTQILTTLQVFSLSLLINGHSKRFFALLGIDVESIGIGNCRDQDYHMECLG